MAAQCGKNLATVASVTVEAQVQSWRRSSGLKDLASLRLPPRSELRFNPWPGNFRMPQVWPLKKKKRLNINLAYDLAILLLAMYPKEVKTGTLNS